jgi:DMSO/TMAO reductase YedYZ molybdopterin-dependent catalytic subunit
MSLISRGFRGRRQEPDEGGRLPPGQYLTDGFPVLSAGPTPHTSLDMWTFSIIAGDEGKSWTWREFRALPSEAVTADIHCVTRWSKLDTTWQGVSVDTLLADVDHDAAYVLAFCDGGYTTNLPIEGEPFTPNAAPAAARRRPGARGRASMMRTSNTDQEA